MTDPREQPHDRMCSTCNRYAALSLRYDRDGTACLGPPGAEDHVVMLCLVCYELRREKTKLDLELAKRLEAPELQRGDETASEYRARLKTMRATMKGPRKVVPKQRPPADGAWFHQEAERLQRRRQAGWEER